MDRSIFAFPETVRKVFGFLCQFHMRERASEPTFVRYESDKVFLNIYHGRSSCEIGAEIGLLQGVHAGKWHSLGALIRRTDPQAAKSYRRFTAIRPQSVKTGLEQLREIILTYAQDALLGDQTVFEELEKIGIEREKCFGSEVRTSQERPKAEAAFRAGKYDEAIRLYASIYKSLTPVELKKLEYAKKHMKKA